MEINECQRQMLSTCMPSCRNIAYPSLGLVEEVGEYVQKLINMIEWNPAFPASEKNHLLLLLNGIVTNAHAVGRLNKAIRHGDFPQPFGLHEYDDEDTDTSHIEALQKELGDVSWMVNCAHFYTVYDDTTDPTVPCRHMTAQLLHEQNHAKLMARQAQNTIDGQGDDIRRPF